MALLWVTPPRVKPYLLVDLPFGGLRKTFFVCRKIGHLGCSRELTGRKHQLVYFVVIPSTYKVSIQ